MNKFTNLLILSFLVFPFVFSIILNNNMVSNYQLYTDTSVKPNNQDVVVFIANNMQNKYTAVMASALRELLKSENINLLIFDSEGNLKKQLQYLAQCYGKNIKAIIISPCHEEKLNSLIEKYYNKNIPVIIVDRKIYKAPFDCYIGQDDVEIGFLQADFILERFGNKKANVLIVAGPENSIVSNERLKGTLAVFKGFGNIHVIGVVHTQNSYNMSYLNVINFLENSHMKIDALIAQSDDMLLGAIQAFSDKKMHVISIGADALSNTLEYIKEGKVTATIYNSSFDIAFETFKVLMKLLKKEMIYSQVFIPSRIITSSDVDRYINEMSFTYLLK